MQYLQQHARSAELICSSYNGSMPLTVFLKQYFGQHKKFGSKDRKSINHLCYTFYRLGKALTQLPFAERLKAALFLCEDEPQQWQVLFTDSWLAQWNADLQTRVHFITSQYPEFRITDIFPWTDQLSEGIDKTEFCLSHLRQPNLFLRIRQGYEENVRTKLDGAGIDFNEVTHNCISLANGTRIDAVLQLNKEAVVQDLSSQRTGELLGEITTTKKLRVWDACAASGGKSIMVKDVLGDIALTVSDIRPSILHNLQQRFREAGIIPEQMLVTDLSQKNTPRPAGQFNLVICDVPCSGSGTWARTPEQLYYFNEKKIDEYAVLQQSIAANAVQAMHPGSWLLYITCSVFREENELQVEHLVRQQELRVIKSSVIKGYDHRADTMFAALLVKD